MAQSSPHSRTPLSELLTLFLKLGAIAFGGPAVHIALLEDEVVTRRRWLTRQHFLDLIGATQLIPGPNSTEMVLHVGYERRGLPGLLIAGIGFIVPAAFLTALLGWFYVRFGSLPAVAPFLAGIQAAVLAVILSALYKLGKKAVKGWELGLLGTGVAVALLLGVREVPALFAGGLIGMLWLRFSRQCWLSRRWAGQRVSKEDAKANEGPELKSWPLVALASSTAAATTPAAAISLAGLGLFFLKVGAILYGSGYVLIAFLESDLVERLGWLTQGQLLDAIAIGQFTPGPVLTTATFIGYVLAGWPGAVVATVGIFLPSFVFVAILNPLVPKLRSSPWTAAFLDAINVSAMALMLVVTIQLARATLDDWRPVMIAVLAVAAVFRLRWNAVWIVLGGAGLGWLLQWV